MAPISSTVAAWALGLRIRQRREEAGLSGSDAAKEIGIAAAYLSDVEHGKKTLSEQRLDVIIGAYEFDQEEAAELRELRTNATLRGWWTKYATLFTPELLRSLGFEHGAERIDAFDSGLINGLLQTEDYARAIIEAGAPNLRMAEVGRRVRCRMNRQQRLTGPDPLQLSVLLGEAALWQQVGGPDVLQDQLTHLIRVIDTHPGTLHVRVVPFEATGHQALSGSSFHLFSFPNSDPPALLWQESVTSTQLITDPLTVREYALTYDAVLACALSREESLRLIRKAAGAA